MTINQAFLTLCLHDWKKLPKETRQKYKTQKSRFLKYRNQGEERNKVGKSTMRELLLMAGYEENWTV